MKTPSDLPRAEYPQPQWQRNQWHNLNGEWDFCFDDHNQGLMEQWFLNGPFNRKIVVPFPFQSALSGIYDTSCHDIVWYRRTVDVQPLEKDQRMILHFGAVDYQADVWFNGHLLAHHTGGHIPFAVDITPYLSRTPVNVLVVRAEDLTHDLEQPRGKQFWEESPRGIFYTRTSGIWQTVWTEEVNVVHLKSGVFVPDIDHHAVTVTLDVAGLLSTNPNVYDLHMAISFGDETLVSDTISVGQTPVQRTIYLPDRADASSRLWSPEIPNIYDVTLTLLRNQLTVDKINSYFGMRKISVLKDRVLVNNRPYTMKLILDQGYFPGGVLTAACDQDYVEDIELIKGMGFNGVRKHQKVEDPRFLYWADKKGLLVWEEMANAYQFSTSAVRRLVTEWQEVIARDINHPCLVAWVPLNESWGVPEILTNPAQQSFAMSLYHLTKSLDPSRLVISNDGWEHMDTDLLTIHDYESQESVLAQRYSTIQNTLASMPGLRVLFVDSQGYQKQPVLLTEFGGIAFDQHTTAGWGYTRAVNPKEFADRLLAVFRPLNTSPILRGYCYTQFTDVEQEVNGLLTFDRKPKLPLKLIRSIVENGETSLLAIESFS